MNEQMRPEGAFTPASYRMADSRCYSPFTRRHFMASQMTLTLLVMTAHPEAIFITAREAIHARTGSGLHPPAHSKTYTIRCCHLSIGVRTWFIIISLLHVAMASKLRSLWHFRASKGARKCGFGFSQLIIRRAERRAAASELLFPPVDSPLSFSILALLTPWELRIHVAEF